MMTVARSFAEYTSVNLSVFLSALPIFKIFGTEVVHERYRNWSGGGPENHIKMFLIPKWICTEMNYPLVRTWQVPSVTLCPKPF